MSNSREELRAAIRQSVRWDTHTAILRAMRTAFRSVATVVPPGTFVVVRAINYNAPMLQTEFYVLRNQTPQEIDESVVPKVHRTIVTDQMLRLVQSRIDRFGWRLRDRLRRTSATIVAHRKNRAVPSGNPVEAICAIVENLVSYEFRLRTITILVEFPRGVSFKKSEVERVRA